MNNNQILFKCVFRYSLVQCLYYYCGALSISLNGSSDGRDVSPLATPATPAFSHPFMRWRFPSLLVQEEEMRDSDEESAEVDDK